MGMENKTRDYYKAQAGKATFKAEKDYYEILAKEETVHHKALFDYAEYLKNPADYFTMKERHSLDWRDKPKDSNLPEHDLAATELQRPG